MTELSRHSQNLNFHWEVRPSDGSRLLSKRQIEQYNEDGFFRLENAVGRRIVDTLLREIDPIEAGLAPTTLIMDDATEVSYATDELTFARNLVATSRLVRDFYRSQLFQDLTYDLLGPDVRLYWDQAVYKKPKKGELFPWHQDTGYTFTMPQDYVTCWLALTDASIDDGCPWIVPGLHKLGTLAHNTGPLGLEICDIDDVEATRHAAPVAVSAGDMVVFSSLAPHKTGPNVSDRVRKALIVQFIRNGTKRVTPDGKKLPLADPLFNMTILQNGQSPARQAD